MANAKKNDAHFVYLEKSFYLVKQEIINNDSNAYNAIKVMFVSEKIAKYLTNNIGSNFGLKKVTASDN